MSGMFVVVVVVSGAGKSAPRQLSAYVASVTLRQSPSRSVVVNVSR